ncbi:lysophospholipid acyltransferase family protein [Leadbetterella sp. DM7]|uniref:lysophospholipid acyltransferase family protein n=1 Tax=Leadbetterella sp. DM7 TaxID=3235085 RepID=UPI00349E6DFD
MKKVVDYILGSLYLLYFGLLMIIFHGVQVIAYRIFGPRAHQKSVEIFNLFIVAGLYMTGSTVSFSQKVAIPTGRTVIFISNHQSMFDIPGIIWFLRKYTPKFVSKKELARGIPGISYNLRVGQAALIDRHDPKQAITEILRFAKHISENHFSAVIFPEGTRSRTGRLKPFAVGGVATLLKKCPGALVVPVAVRNTGRFNPKGLFPLSSFTAMSWTTLDPVEPAGRTPEDVVADCEKQIAGFLGQNPA